MVGWMRINRAKKIPVEAGNELRVRHRAQDLDGVLNSSEHKLLGQRG